MTTIQSFVEIDAPASTAYNVWSRCDLFPHFMEGIEAVEPQGLRKLHWRARILGREEEWDAEITEQIPDKRIAWTSSRGAENAGVVTFHRLSDDTSRVALQLAYEPDGVVEQIGDAIGAVRHRVEADLARFKDFVEKQGDRIEGVRREIPALDDAAQQQAG